MQLTSESREDRACRSPGPPEVPSALEERGAELVDEAGSWDVLWADDRVDEVGQWALRPPHFTTRENIPQHVRTHTIALRNTPPVLLNTTEHARAYQSIPEHKRAYERGHRTSTPWISCCRLRIAVVVEVPAGKLVNFVPGLAVLTNKTTLAKLSHERGWTFMPPTDGPGLRVGKNLNHGGVHLMKSHGRPLADPGSKHKV